MFAVAALLVVALFLLGCGGGGGTTIYPPPPQPFAGKLPMTGWTLEGGNPNPLQYAPGEFAFDFPVAKLGDPHQCVAVDCPRVNYVVLPTYYNIAAAASLSFSYEIKGAAVYQAELEPSNTCGGPATLQLWLRQYGNPMGRWWARPAVELREGVGTFSVGLDPANWWGVSGQSATADPYYKAALQSLGSIGFTFGGSCFSGHGVYAESPSRFIARSYEVK
jgi:hypothetical protein